MVHFTIGFFFKIFFLSIATASGISIRMIATQGRLPRVSVRNAAIHHISWSQETCLADYPSGAGTVTLATSTGALCDFPVSNIRPRHERRPSIGIGPDSDLI